MQLDVFETHQHENNSSSQSHLNENKKHFNKQCEKVYDILMSGTELSVLSAITEERIHSLPRRLLDLKNQGVSISERWNDQISPKTKVWFMNGNDMKKNSEKFK